MNHHPDRGSDSDFNDPGGWNKASYFDDPIDSIEPLPDKPNEYRQVAIYYLGIMFAVDEFLETAARCSGCRCCGRRLCSDGLAPAA
jgi:hypothetical protein